MTHPSLRSIALLLPFAAPAHAETLIFRDISDEATLEVEIRRPDEPFVSVEPIPDKPGNFVVILDEASFEERSYQEIDILFRWNPNDINALRPMQVRTTFVMRAWHIEREYRFDLDFPTRHTPVEIRDHAAEAATPADQFNAHFMIRMSALHIKDILGKAHQTRYYEAVRLSIEQIWRLSNDSYYGGLILPDEQIHEVLDAAQQHDHNTDKISTNLDNLIVSQLVDLVTLRQSILNELSCPQIEDFFQFHYALLSEFPHVAREYVIDSENENLTPKDIHRSRLQDQLVLNGCN